MKKVITTVGTSIFENFARSGDAGSAVRKYHELKDKRLSCKSDFTSEVSALKHEVTAWLSKPEHSAELQSLDQLRIESNDQLEVYLIKTDTILSELAAEIIAENKVLQKTRFRNIAPIADLDVEHFSEFEDKGLNNLIDQLYQLIEPDLEKTMHGLQEWIINITGGYKGVIPFLTLFGQMNGIRMTYLHEKSKALIIIPQKPIGYDFSLTERLYLHFDNARIDPGKVPDEEMELLLKYGFFKAAGSKKYKETSLGKMFRHIVGKTEVFAKNVTGHTVELLMYEYCNENKYRGFPHFRRGDEYLNRGSDRKLKGGEIDLLGYHNPADPYSEPLVMEVKGLPSFLGETPKIINQLKEKKKLLEKHTVKPAVLEFLLYTSIQKNFDNARNDSTLKAKLSELKKELGDLPLTVTMLYLPMDHREGENPFLSIIEKHITQNQLKEINL